MFRKKKSEAERKNWKFCSRHCQVVYGNKDRRLPCIIKKCFYCGDNFNARLKREINKVFCSKKCSLTSRNKTDKQRKSTPRGKECWNWRGGKTLDKFSHTPEGRKWRKSVFERDDYTCQKCKQRGGKLNAHHIKEILSFQELKDDIKNGITLCEGCHKKTNNWGIKSVWRNRKGLISVIVK